MLARVEDISVPIPPVAADTNCAAALSLFLSDTSLFALPLRGEDGTLTLVTRAAVTEAMAGPEGRSVWTSQPVSMLASKSPQIVEATTPAGLAAGIAAGQNPNALGEGLIIVQDGVYRGLVSPAALTVTIAGENAARARTLGQAARRMEAAKAKLNSAAREKADFLAFLGHEIRTPLTGILGVADLLQDSVSGGEPKRLARTISESGHHLERLLNDLLDLSRLEAGKMPLHAAPFDLDEFAAEARDVWQPRSDGKRVALRIHVEEGTPRIEADALRLRQILFNLLSNALKFTEAGHVDVSLATWRDESSLRLRMSVSDTGCGISEHDKARLFEAFEQASAKTAHVHGGSGLGLAIAKSLARAMGGEISLADNPDGGSIFTVDLPVQKAGPRLVASPAQEKTLRPQMGKFELGRILVIEDHAASALVITEALRAAGWDVDHAGTAEAAREYMFDVGYQAILTDIHLPDETGDMILSALRTTPGPNSEIPVLAVTADLTDTRRTACKAAGFVAMIEKPIRPRTMVATLADILMMGDSPDAWARVG
nr:ATP-binding protein [uncultured Hyphomonas sp.]